ncbi:Rpn family recombination-promoting nuclease/putative transposase [Methanospirillum stamsii]|nr:Rpn family recombination-promoting nuclease/putative transposase [Methanospirillum stamsii]
MPYILTRDGDEIMSPKNDFAFRLLFSDPQCKDVLIDLLNTIIPENIQDLHLLDTHLLCSATQREGILDIRARTDAKVQINVEMQLHNLPAMDKRTLYYWAIMYIDQFLPGQKYHELNKTITINLLDYYLLPVDDLHTCFHVHDSKYDIRLSDALEIHFLELPKVHRYAHSYENKDLINWLKFINARNEEELYMAAETKPPIKKAFETLKAMSRNEENKRLYEAREIFLSDQATRVYAAKEEGRVEGIEEGRKEGIEEGREEERITFARNLISLGMDDEFIMKATGLNKPDLDSLKNTRNSNP